MEKLVCVLWRSGDEPREAFNARLLGTLPAALEAAGARGMRINLRDAEVEPASSLAQQWQEPQQEAVVQFWLTSANDRFRAGIDAALASHCLRFAMWLAAESVIIPNTCHPAVKGQRTFGWSQASFITFRPDLPREQCRAHWQGHHTRIAIETQANFEYVQNQLVQSLTPDAPAYDAFVEECFPPLAMTDPAAFYDAVGDGAKFKANLDAMMASCAAFIDFARIEIMPTSQYDF
jgi:hypothetical protein